MNNIAYVSVRKEEGIMTSLGLDHIYYDGVASFEALLRELKYKQYQLVFVSEAIYTMHQAVIDRYNTDLSISIHVLGNHLEHEEIGKKRLKHLSEDAVGFHGE